MNKDEIIYWLKQNDETELEKLWQQADEIRKINRGDEVFLRGLIEISNYCARRCGYCGINVENKTVTRYRMTRDEIIDCARQAKEFDYGTVVMQAGEDFGLTTDFIADLITTIKSQFKLNVTLSLGERRQDELVRWKQAGADRYLLRFETSNPELFARIHPPLTDKPVDRIALLRQMREIGYEIGSGVLIGIPGQSYSDLADDILLFGTLDLDMIGVGPFIPHPATDLGTNQQKLLLDAGNQVPNTELSCYKVIALSRIICPQSNIPSTTALATLNKADGREKGLCRGANVLMPNMTPVQYRRFYEIYPAKACIDETARQCRFCMEGRIHSIGREISKR